MPEIKLKTTISIDGVGFRPGEIVEVDDSLASDLIYRNRAEKIQQQSNYCDVCDDVAVNKRKVAIVGTSGTRIHAPYDDKRWEIWTLNHRTDLFTRSDRHFELHDLKRPIGIEYIDFLKDRCVYLAESKKELPDALIYPKEKIIAEFGDFFTNSVSWMIALAIFEDVGEIGLWGVDMALNFEYGYQKASVLYFIGFALGRKIKITAAKYSKIFEGVSAPSVNCDNKFNTLFYLGYAAGQGIKFIIPENSELFKKDKLYWLHNPKGA